jgi:hypothetical protein
MRVDCPSADGGTGAPDLPQQLDAGSDGPPASHERQQESELGVSHPHRLASAKHGLSSRFQEDTAEANGPGPAGRGSRRQATGAVQQLLHSGDELADHRHIRCPGVVRVRRGRVRHIGIGRQRRSDLVLVHHRSPLGLMKEGVESLERSLDRKSVVRPSFLRA